MTELPLLLGIVGTCWLPGPTHSDATEGFEVDTSSRNEVLSFYNSIYLSSSDYRDHIGWEGDYSICRAGGTSVEFNNDVKRRLNFYRAMAGVPADARLNEGAKVVIDGDDSYKPNANTTRQAAAEAAALMVSWQGDVSHNPGTNWFCWSRAAWNAANKGALSLGFFGPEAIDAYVRENDPTSLSIWNTEVGHRRWILYPAATEFGSGDAPGYVTQRPANVLYVLPGDEQVLQPASFTAWPPVGYCPDHLCPLLWSLAYPGGDFANATVRVEDAEGRALAIDVMPSTQNYGDNAIVWRMPEGVLEPTAGSDRTYQVVVTGIGGNGPSSFSYEVTLFDVNTLGEDWTMGGATDPPLSGANYFFEPVPGAEEYRFEVSQPTEANWTEGAENGTLSQIIDGTSPVYDLSSGSHSKSGNRSFRMAFPEGNEQNEDQSFTIDRLIIPSANTKLSYHYRRGWMVNTTTLTVEYSSDGSSWTTVDTINGRTGKTDSGFTNRNVTLPHGSALLVRFRLSHPNDAVDYGLSGTSSNSNHGIFIDQITTSNAFEPANLNVTSLPADALFARFDEATAGQSLEVGEDFTLNLKAVIGGKEYATDEVLAVQVAPAAEEGFTDWLAFDYPLLSGEFTDDYDGDGLADGLEYAVGTDPLQPDAGLALQTEAEGGELCLALPIDPRGGVNYSGEWSSDLDEWFPLEGNFEEGLFILKHRFEGKQCGYLRLKVSEP
ncbi:MAG: hypothetical protein Q7Q71_04455 [Verrucomicrobiota bacterium JB023]|nr:hypothetical protein [Verrucomicrobiota bacterium JB023]